MKKVMTYLPYILFTVGFVSFILPVVYDKYEGGTLYYNMFDLMFGLNGQSASIGLIFALIIFLIRIIFSITLETNS